jgi:hypothetical protein
MTMTSEMLRSRRWGSDDEPTIKHAIRHADELSARHDLDVGKGVVYAHLRWTEIGRRIVLIMQDDLHADDRSGVFYASVNGTELPERFWFKS